MFHSLCRWSNPAFCTSEPYATPQKLRRCTSDVSKWGGAANCNNVYILYLTLRSVQPVDCNDLQGALHNRQVSASMMLFFMCRHWRYAFIVEVCQFFPVLNICKNSTSNDSLRKKKPCHRHKFTEWLKNICDESWIPILYFLYFFHTIDS